MTANRSWIPYALVAVVCLMLGVGIGGSWQEAALSHGMVAVLAALVGSLGGAVGAWYTSKAQIESARAGVGATYWKEHIAQTRGFIVRTLAEFDHMLSDVEGGGSGILPVEDATKYYEKGIQLALRLSPQLRSRLAALHRAGIHAAHLLRDLRGEEELSAQARMEYESEADAFLEGAKKELDAMTKEHLGA